MKLASRLSQVSASLTLAIDAKAKAMKAQGIDLCNFTVGEPDFDTPKHVIAAARQALESGKTKYGPAGGEPKLREAIARKLRQENGLQYQSEDVLVTNGGKQSLFNCLLALLNEGDEVIIPAPYWLSYPEMVRMAGATPVIVKTEPAQGFRMTAEMLERAITPRSRVVILNSPSNPTGMVYSRAELQALAEVIVRRNLLVISDEIYEKLIYGVEQVSIGSLGPEIFSRTIISNGFAKAYAMTGWRVGYLAGPRELIQAATKIQSHSTSNVCTFAQYGALAALEGDQSCVQEMLASFAKRRELICGLVDQIPNVSLIRPTGAFYVFIDIRNSRLGSLQFCEKLLEEAQVAAIPGAVFGDDAHIRFSYATDPKTIQKGMERLTRFMQR